ncbi:aromatic ring-hydroxylating oxygenase subunit alpha [Pseudonocardia spinosispora]|uniref:aromatic ring-hydroxylating oxygenase subunit alpha n=1 Tax=Pseudonocardia spinosispora TaxID=103441 RepID=UPI0003F52C6D|nr:Rieske 2Fe-2S domain-containing protein [Pseudonocardia spinosispora]
MPTKDTRTRRQDVPNEGDGGVFSQQWFPVCLSSEVAADAIRGTDFLDGRVIVVRDDEGVASVLSAFCAHLGVDLSVGKRVGDRVQCPFHFWEYDSRGSCVATGAGDRVPRDAKLFRFPTQEMYGIIFAFNGETPLYELPRYPVADDSLVFKAGALDWVLSIDPWVISANTPDLAHITLLHDFEMVNDPYQHVEWTDHSMTFPVQAKLPTGQMWDVHAGIYGTNYFFQHGEMDGRWFGWSTPFGIPNPGQTKVYYIIAAQPLDGESAEDTDKFLDYALGVEMHIASQDMPVFEGIHYLPRNLTRSDRVLARFFEYVRRYPRAHPSAAFIR